MTAFSRQKLRRKLQTSAIFQTPRLLIILRSRLSILSEATRSQSWQRDITHCQRYSRLSRDHDYSHPLLLLWQGMIRCHARVFYASILTYCQVIADLWERYLELLGQDIKDGYALSCSFQGDGKLTRNSDAMDQLGLNRYCCRRMLMTHVDLIEKLLRSVKSHLRLSMERLLTYPTRYNPAERDIIRSR